MPYTHTTWLQLRQQLATRLGDVGNIYWVDDELKVLLTEALRTYGLLTGFTRARGNFLTTAATAFYDINALLTDGTLLLATTVTDRDIILSLQYALLESTASQITWTGTEQFTYADVANAVQNRLNQFLMDTGVVVNYSLLGVAAPPLGRVTLNQATVDVRRVAWLSSLGYYNPLWREDERSLTAASYTWVVPTNDDPESYSIMAPPPLVLQLASPPLQAGQLELLTVDSVFLDPATNPTLLGIPDDLSPAIKWGALADLLGKDGIARDPVRADFAEKRYQQYVQLARLLPVVIHALIEDVPLIPCTLQELESSTPLWQNIEDTPQDIVLASTNLVALNPMPDDEYTITLDVVRRTPIPVLDGDFVQIGREQLDSIIDYAEHLALFKCAGAEWHASEQKAQNFLIESITYNQRTSAAARSIFSAAEQSQRQKQGIPRRLDTSAAGAGALKSLPNARD